LLVLTALALIPVLDLVLPAVGIEPSGRRFSPSALEVRLPDLVNGRFGEKVESFFQDRSFIVHGSGARYNEWVYRLTGRLPGLRVGGGNWLFLRSHLDELERESAATRVAENTEFIKWADEKCLLPEQQLFVVFIPDRGRLYPDIAFSDGVPPENRRLFLSEATDALKEEGIAVLDLTETFRKEVEAGRDPFFDVDHHWNYHGSKVAADAVSEWLFSQTKIPDHSPLRKFSVSTAVVDGSPNRSLVTLMKWRKKSQMEQRFLRKQEILSIRPTLAEMTPDDANPTGSGITLESSFGLFGFPQFLEQSLGARIDSIVEPGNGSVYSMARYVSGGDLSEQHSFVLWVIPEYHLIEGLKNQGAGRLVKFPEPFTADEFEFAKRAQDIRVDGLSASGRDWEVEKRKSRVHLKFDQPVSGIQLSFRCVGGVKRGQIFCPPSAEEGLLVFAGTPEIMSYDFRLDQAAREVEVELLINESGVSLRRLRAYGIPAASSISFEEEPAT